MHVYARAAVPIVTDVKESFSERHAKNTKLPMGVIKVYSVFCAARAYNNDGIAVLLHGIRARFRVLLHIKTCAVASMMLFESVCIA